MSENESSKKYVMCNDCGKTHLWSKEEYQEHASDGCSCGCCVFSIGDTLQDARSIAAMTKIN